MGKTTKTARNLFEYLEKNKLNGKIGAVVKGLVFVGGSMASYSIGQKYGDIAANRVEANLGLKKTAQKINRMT